MINIVKYPKNRYARHRFTCDNCECVFDADVNDYKYTTMPVGHNTIKEYYCIHCPICGHYLVKEKHEIKTIIPVLNSLKSNVVYYMNDDE